MPNECPSNGGKFNVEITAPPRLHTLRDFTSKLFHRDCRGTPNLLFVFVANASDGQLVFGAEYAKQLADLLFGQMVRLWECHVQRLDAPKLRDGCL